MSKQHKRDTVLLTEEERNGMKGVILEEQHVVKTGFVLKGHMGVKIHGSG